MGIYTRTCSKFKNTDYIRALYNSLIKSRLEYAAIVWNLYCKQDILQIEKVQRKYLKYIYYITHNAYPTLNISYANLLSLTNDQSLHYRRLLSGIKYFYKLIHEKIPCIFLVNLLPFSDRRHSTRRPTIFTNPIPRSNMMLKSPVYTICANINAICNMYDFFCSNFNVIEMKFCEYYNVHLNIYV